MKKKYKDVYYDVPDVKTIKELVIHGVGEGKDQPLFMYVKPSFKYSKILVTQVL